MGSVVQPDSTENVVRGHFFTDEESRILFRCFRDHFPDYMVP